MPPSGQHSFKQMARDSYRLSPRHFLREIERELFPICPFNMGTDFRGRNIINPLPQRMVHHTSHGKEHTCLLKGKKNVQFVLHLRNLIKLQGRVWHGYVHPRAAPRCPSGSAPGLGAWWAPGPGSRQQAGAVSLLPGFLLLLEAEACASVQFSLFLSKIVGPGSACSGFQDVVHLEHDFIDGSSIRFKVEVLVVVIA